MLPLQGARVRSLVKELRKKKKEKESSSLQEGDGVRKVLKCKEGLGDRAGLRWKVL